MKRALLPALILLLAACEQSGDPGPGGVTVGEAQALDDAAEMLEQGRPPLPVEAGEASGGAAPAAPEEGEAPAP